MHNLAGYLHCDVIKSSTVQPEFVYFFFNAQPLSSNSVFARLLNGQLAKKNSEIVSAVTAAFAYMDISQKLPCLSLDILRLFVR